MIEVVGSKCFNSSILLTYFCTVTGLLIPRKLNFATNFLFASVSSIICCEIPCNKFNILRSASGFISFICLDISALMSTFDSGLGISLNRSGPKKIPS